MKVLAFFVSFFTAAAVVSLAQSQPSPAPPQGAAAPTISAVSASLKHGTPPAQPIALAPDAVVIAVHGLCEKESAKSAGADECVTKITREQFELMLAAMSFNPQMRSNPVAVRGFAESYVQALAQADAAEKADFDKDPKFQELMNIVRVRTLADSYRRLQLEAANRVAAQDIETYYHDHLADYYQVELDRIFIPRVGSKATKEDRGTFEKRARQVAERIHERAAKGDDMLTLQVQAYKELGLTPPLSTDMGAIRRGKLAPGIAKDIFSTHPDDVTKVEEDGAGFTIYKVRTRNVLPLERVRDEIIHDVAQKQIEASTKAVTERLHSELNEQFFSTQHAVVPPVR